MGEIICGDALTELKGLPSGCVHCCVTSPPYWGLRDYGVEGQLGLERTPEEYVAKLVDVFREVRRVLRDDGTLWLNLGDSYGTVGNRNGLGSSTLQGSKSYGRGADAEKPTREQSTGLKPKDLVGIPWRVAFALQADGWYLRSDIIWAKPNPMPESVTDRPTKAHEYIFLLAKSERYWYDAEAIAEQSVYPDDDRKARSANGQKRMPTEIIAGIRPGSQTYPTRNRRSVWTVATKPFKGAHFATFPPDLIRPCILAGCPVGGTVLDPFFGAGTTGLVAKQEGRDYIGIELNPAYAEMARERIRDVVAEPELV